MLAPQTEVLVFADGFEAIRKAVGPGSYTFGRMSSCDFPIKVELVSREHARLTVSDSGALLIEDLESANGTFLDGQRVSSPTGVRPNQTIQIGNASVLVQQRIEDTQLDIGRAERDAEVPKELSHATHYEIGVQLAKGGMGAVLIAKQPAIRREVAMKIMVRDEGYHDRLRFIEEAQLTGQLEHPNIVPVHDLALNEQGQPYYTMKLVKGATLKRILQMLNDGDSAILAKYPIAVLLTIFQKICDAVAFAHDKGVIHRDLKPDNIMIGEYGEVLVMDWGIAKAVGIRATAPDPAELDIPSVQSARLDVRDAYSTLDGAVLGTPAYMSPEQARGEVSSLDRRSDIFSLGIILYELVTLRQPFVGKDPVEILEQIKKGECATPNQRLSIDNLRPPHLGRGVVPDSLEAIILKALTPMRSNRYASVKKLQADLTAYQGGFATMAERAGAWKQFRFFVKRHRALFVSIVLALLTAVGTWTAVTRGMQKPSVAPDELRSAHAQREKAESSLRRTESDLAKARTDASNAQMAVANARSDTLKALEALRRAEILSLRGPVVRSPGQRVPKVATTNDSAAIAPGYALGLLPVRFERLKDNTGLEQLTLQVPITAHSDSKIDASRVMVQVNFYEVTNNREIVPTNGPIATRWKTAPTWATEVAEELSIEYKPQKSATPSEKREYCGYTLLLYYDDKLQAATSDLKSLAEAAPATPARSKRR